MRIAKVPAASREETRVALLAADVAAFRLGIPSPKVFLFLPDSNGDLDVQINSTTLGFCRDEKEIYVRADLKPRDKIQTIFHEVRHARDWRVHWDDRAFHDPESSERRVELFLAENHHLWRDDTYPELYNRLLATQNETVSPEKREATLRHHEYISEKEARERQKAIAQVLPELRHRVEPQPGKWPSTWSAESIQMAERFSRAMQQRTKHWLNECSCTATKSCRDDA